MSTEANKEIIRAFVGAVNAQEWDRLDDLVAVDVVRHGAHGDLPGVRSRDQLKEFLQREAETFPDATETIRSLIAEGDAVAARLDFRGTQSGPMGPFPATHQVLESGFIAIFRIADRRIAEVWVEWDNLGALIQLGHLEPLG